MKTKKELKPARHNLSRVCAAWLVLSAVFACSELDDKMAAFAPILGDTSAPEVLYSVPAHGAAGVADNQGDHDIFYQRHRPSEVHVGLQYLGRRSPDFTAWDFRP